MCLSNFKAIRQFKVPISWLRDFTRSYDKTSFRILRRGPDYDPSIPMYRIHSWKITIYDWKNSNHNFISWKDVKTYLQQIFNSLLCISFAFRYIWWLEIMYMCNFWCKTCNTFIKIMKYLYKMILITQTTFSCVVKCKQTTLSCNITQVSVSITFEWLYVTIQLKIYHWDGAIYRGWAFCPKGWAFCPHKRQDAHLSVKFIK